MCQQGKMQQWMRGLLLAVFAALSVISISACTSTPFEPSTLRMRNGGELTLPARSSTVSSDVGRFHALVIGNQDYLYLDKLQTPRHDAKEVAELLEQQYGFNVELLFDANREKIMRALSKLRDKLINAPKEDSLLIYYAGHGWFDEATKTGYWQPIDAKKDNNVNWIRTEEVTDLIVALKQINHFMVIADSCYADWTVKSKGGTDIGLPEAFSWKWQRKSRHALTSGAKETIPDAGPDNHALLAYSFLAALRNNYSAQTIIDGHKLFDQIATQVAIYIKEHPKYPAHHPVYDIIPNLEDAHGDFLFFPVDQAGAKNIKKELLTALLVQTSSDPSVEAYRANLPQSAPRIKNIKIVYNPSRLGLAQQISKELQRNNFPAKLEAFDTWNIVALHNGLTSRELPLGAYTIFFPDSLQESIGNVSQIVTPLLTDGNLTEKALYEKHIIDGASIGTDEAMIVLK